MNIQTSHYHSSYSPGTTLSPQGGASSAPEKLATKPAPESAADKISIDWSRTGRAALLGAGLSGLSGVGGQIHSGGISQVLSTVTSAVAGGVVTKNPFALAGGALLGSVGFALSAANPGLGGVAFSALAGGALLGLSDLASQASGR